MNRFLIAPLSAALCFATVSGARAQSAFPAPLPSQSAAPAAASPFPPVNGAPSAVIGGSPGGAFPSAGAPPVGGFSGAGPGPQAGPPPGAEDCMKGFVPLREDAEKRGNLIKAASARRAPPDEACKLIGNFAQAEIKMIKYVETNARKCGIPSSVADQLKNGHKNTSKMQAQVCNVAQQQQQRGPAGPSLSEVLGSSAALPEASTSKKGGSTFDTLNGNVLSR
ncbi:MAG: hypothetical protein JWR73_2403 [Tardiphaga sp.]|jgi:hypothetical protein|nr:hypothetical protein [Tardiphaga sp.]MDB5546863.1 hypothetical protein [Tardiphaga sp.]MDB5626601.1 hypothetical protein [Tardiphaga sp.]MDB5629449.1 hypothetical protein [Tardiphaga sp.]